MNYWPAISVANDKFRTDHSNRSTVVYLSVERSSLFTGNILSQILPVPFDFRPELPEILANGKRRRTLSWLRARKLNSYMPFVIMNRPLT